MSLPDTTRVGTLFVTLLLFTILGANTRVFAQSPVQPTAKPSAKPNILIILADDLGYGDLESYNSNSLIPTPHLNRLASEGIRFTQAYCPVAVCSPSRYALMTGRYSFRSWKKTGVLANYEPSMIASDLLTLPEMLREAGYTTAGFGKWHLGAIFPTLDGKKPAGYGQFQADDNGANLDLSKPVRDGPLDHGFDYWLGFSCASECWILENKHVMGFLQHDFYTTEAAPNAEHLQAFAMTEYLPFITNQTLDYLKKQATNQSNQPFFLYYSPYVPHVPLAVNEEFRGSTEAGLYGDYVHELDVHIGRILNTLDSLTLTDNTIVFFASDNGSHFTMAANEINMAEARNQPFNVDKDIQLDKVHYPNGHLRGTKRTAWEGGVRTPLIARWPGHFPANAESKELFALNDMMATLASVVGYELPDDAAQDSYDLLPALKGEERNTRQIVVVQSSGSVMGLRWGPWKYITPDDDNPEGELYDLSVDESESVNLYRQQPEVVKKMQHKLNDLLSSKRSAL